MSNNDLGFMPIYDLDDEEKNLVAAVVFEAGANKDDNFKKRVASTIFNRLDTKSSEFNAQSGSVSDVVYKPDAYYEVNKDRVKKALIGEFDNDLEQKAFEDSQRIVDGISSGELEKDPGKFWFNDEEIESLKTSKKFDFNKVTQVGAQDEFKFFDYPDKLQENKIIQEKLIEKGFNPGMVDGKIGPKTKEAIKKFQMDSGLTVDGIAGPKTKGKLLSALNPFSATEASADTINEFEDLGFEPMDAGEYSDLGFEPMDAGEYSDLGFEPEGKENKRNFAKNIKESFQRGQLSAQIDQASYLAKIGKLDFDKDVRPLIEQRDKVLSADPIKGGNIISSALYSVSEMMPAMISGTMEGVAAGTLAGGMAVAGGVTAPAAPTMTAAGMAAGSFSYWNRQGEGQLYADMKMSGIPDNISKPVSSVGGPLYAAIEFSQVDKLIPGAKNASKLLISDSLKRTIGKMLLKYGKTWASEVGEEGLQEIVMQTSKEVAGKLSGDKKENQKIIGDVMTSGWDAMKESALPMLFLLGPSAAVDASQIPQVEKIKGTVRKEMARRVFEEAKIQEEKQKEQNPVVIERDAEGNPLQTSEVKQEPIIVTPTEPILPDNASDSPIEQQTPETAPEPEKGTIVEPVKDSQGKVGSEKALIEEKIKNIIPLLETVPGGLLGEPGEANRVRSPNNSFAWPALQNKGYTQKELNNIFNKALEGKKLTEKQKSIYDEVVSEYDAIDSISKKKIDDADDAVITLRQMNPDIKDQDIETILKELENEELWDDERTQRAIESYIERKNAGTESKGEIIPEKESKITQSGQILPELQAPMEESAVSPKRDAEVDQKVELSKAQTESKLEPKKEPDYVVTESELEPYRKPDGTIGYRATVVNKEEARLPKLTESKASDIIKSEEKDNDTPEEEDITRRNEPGIREQESRASGNRRDSLASGGSEQKTKGIDDKGLAETTSEGTRDRLLERTAENYQITDSDQLGAGTIRVKFDQNINAIKILKQIESEKRDATPEEQSQLVKYVGWGGMSQVFDRFNESWAEKRNELKKLLDSDEYSAAQASTINAHYTAPGVIRAMWQAVGNMGFHKGNVLEPSAGVGHFIGLAPKADKKFSVVELDSITGRIAKLLYPKASTQVTGFETSKLPSNYFDLAISNVPFSSYKPYDPRAKAQGIPSKLVLHDYFFAKSLELVKEGGIVAFVTSSGTMDKGDSSFREYLNKKSKFLGAIRLPSDAFKKNAMTEVVTDIIFLQKLKEGEIADNVNFINLGISKGVEVNQYFVDNPNMVIGKLALGKGLYSDNEMTVTSRPTYEQDLAEAIDKLPKDIFDVQTKNQTPDTLEDLETDVKENSFVVRNGKIYQNLEGKLTLTTDIADVKRMEGLIKIKENIRDLIRAEQQDNKNMEMYRKSLNENYDKFVKKYGYLNDPKNIDLIVDDPDSPLISSIEDVKKVEKNKYEYTKREIFSQRVNKRHERPTSARNAQEALHISLGEIGEIDIDYIGQLLNMNPVNAQKALIETNAVFLDPNGTKLVTHNDYLSGNVRVKLEEAKSAATINPEFKRNVTALEAIQPKLKTFENITAKLGMPWIKPETYDKFMRSLGLSGKTIFNTATGTFAIEKNNRFSRYYGTSEEYGVGSLSGEKLLERIMNGRPIVVKEKFLIDGKTQTIVNEEQTELAKEKAEIIKEKFKTWFWTDDTQRAEYEKIYNEEWNHTIPKKFDGGYLVFPEMNKNALPGPLRKPQLDAISRGLTTDRLMLAHSVGAGKTAIMTIMAMENKRIKMSNKSLIIAPKNTLPSWRNHINSLYPGAKVLIANDRNFTSKKLKKFLANTASGNWDIVVMSHDNYEKLPVSPDAYEAFVQEQIDDLREAKENAKESGSRITVKNIETSIKKLEAKLKETLDQSKKLDLLYFEELGIDALYVDEADLYKNLAYSTVKEKIKGMGTQTGSVRAMDMKMKTDILRARNGKIVFATGTPISNSMVEAYTMMKYLQPELLKAQNIKSFDGWANTFGVPTTELEIDVTGARYKLVTRFKNFMNMNELRTMIGEVWDIQTQKMLIDSGVFKRGVNLPNIKGGAANNIVLPQSKDLQDYTVSLIERAKAIEERKGKPEKGDDIMLTVMQDGLKAALDMRMIDPTLAPDPNSKIEWTLNMVIKKHKEYSDIKGTQIIFIDRPAPDKKAPFNPQTYMKKKLVESGIPENEIAFIHDYDTEDQKAELYEKMNEGKIRILFGSTEKLGAGTNIQKRLSVLYHLGIPQAMRPRDITQREGRIDRPGNMNKEIEIYRLAQKGSLDTFIYQMLEAKSKTVEQFMKGNTDLSEFNEADVDPYEAMKALSSDNPLVKDKVEVDKDVRRLKALYNAYLGERTKASGTQKTFPAQIDKHKKDLSGYEKFKANMPEKPTKETFKIEIGNEVYNDKKQALDAIFEKLKNIQMKTTKPVVIGNYLGYPLGVTKDIVFDKVRSHIGIDIDKDLYLFGQVSADPIGTFSSLDYGIFKDVANYISNLQKAITEKEKALNYANELLSSDFNKQAELDEKLKKQRDIDKALKTAKVEESIQQEGIDEDRIDLGIGIAPMPQSAKKPVNDKIKGVSFTNPDIEARYRLSKRNQTGESIKSKLRDYFTEMFHRATRTYPNLPFVPEYANLRNILSKLNISNQVVKDRALRNIDAITAGFGPKKLDLFTRKIILDDLQQEALLNKPLPFGYSEIVDGAVITRTEELEADLANINNLIDQNPDIKNAVENREKLWKAITSELVSNGILKEEQIKSNYFRHQILEYAEAKSKFGPGRKLRKPRPGYAKRRKGSTFDINTDYLQVETEVMAQALKDIQTAKSLKQIEYSTLNIISRLRAEAKEINKEKEEGEKITWEDLIPQGYTTWQPQEGNVFFTAMTIPERIIEESVLSGLSINKDDLKSVLAIGKKLKQFVVPEEVAKTLEELYPVRNPNFITQGARFITSKWKQWILLNPRRAIKYNLQNFFGDLDAVIAGDPRILKYIFQANKELIDMFYREKPMTRPMREYFERGGFSSGLTFQEVPSINELELFNRFKEKKTVKDQLNFMKSYWSKIVKFTAYRETILRYAAYLHYSDLINKGELKNYGGSISSEIDALSNPKDKAAKLATELLGDYANISSLGKDLRETIFPFFSWMEINLKRYSRLLRNSMNEVGPKGIIRTTSVLSLKGGMFLTKFFVRAMLMTAAISLYNHTRFPDEEEEISEYDRNRMHIILGRSKDGDILLLRTQGAFADVIEWFGLDASATLWREYFSGKESLAGIFGRIPFTNLPAFGLNPLEGKLGLHPASLKLIRAVTPVYKLPVETLTGRSLPVFDDKSWKVTDKIRNIMKAISAENEYDLISGKPSKGYGRSLLEAFVSIQDPEENAYRYIQGQKYKFLETVKGRGGSGDYYSPRSLLIRQYKKALRFNDESALTRLKDKMYKIGITKKEIDSSLKTSNPLSGLSKADKLEFYKNYLTLKERTVLLDRANEYYKKTFFKNN